MAHTGPEKPAWRKTATENTEQWHDMSLKRMPSFICNVKKNLEKKEKWLLL